MNKLKKKITFYLIATETSGDVIGANLIKSLKKLDKRNQFIFYGIGGPKMIKVGLKKSLFSIDRLSIFGFFEIIPKLYNIYHLLKKTEKNLIKIKPNFLITIDSPDFNFRVLKRISKKIKAKKIHYVAPTVWAWRKGRAKFLSNHIDKLLTILPFEGKYFNKYKLNTKFVGHPVYEINRASLKKRLTNKYNIESGSKILSFLPGSRHSELKKTLPVFIDLMSSLKESSNIKTHVFFHILPHLKKYFYKYKLNFSYSLVNDEDKYDAFKMSHVAIATSGTVAIELSYLNVPTIIIYKLNLFSYFIAKPFIKIKFANLINIIENKLIIPEFLQFNCQPKFILKELFNLLKKKNANHQIYLAKKCLLKLRSNNKKPSLNAANEIIREIKNFSLK